VIVGIIVLVPFCGIYLLATQLLGVGTGVDAILRRFKRT
jgi:hypothetical protein